MNDNTHLNVADLAALAEDAGAGLQAFLREEELVARVALAVCTAILEQDGTDFEPAKPWDMSVAYLDQGAVDFARVAAAAIREVRASQAAAAPEPPGNL